MYELYPSPVHRLDRPTSGVLISAYTKEAARIMGESFQEGKVIKKYIAVVRGYLPETGNIEIPLKKDGEGIYQEALTFYKTLGQIEVPIENNQYKTSRYSLVEATPHTGRYHQIRRHLARIGHPVIGDTSHGDLRHNKLLKSYFQNQRLLLHGLCVTFPHPLSGMNQTITAPVPLSMERIVRIFNGDGDHHEHVHDQALQQ
jgi:tRNA pseudouridine65 synthase